MSSNASVKTPEKQPSGTRGTPSRVCVICRRAIAQDDVAIDIHGVSAHGARARAPRQAPTGSRVVAFGSHSSGDGEMVADWWTT
jgi:hypothetical protein